MTRQTFVALRLALAAAAATACLFASTADSYAGVYAHRSHVTGRPTLLPRYYGGDHGTGGYYGPYASGDYPGAYANRSYVTGRPTLLPRYYGGYDDAYAAGGYPDSYYGGYANPFPQYHGGPKGLWY
jgi:hypothetical protein